MGVLSNFVLFRHRRPPSTTTLLAQSVVSDGVVSDGVVSDGVVKDGVVKDFWSCGHGYSSRPASEPPRFAPTPPPAPSLPGPDPPPSRSRRCR
jgi:hypothetical protein